MKNFIKLKDLKLEKVAMQNVTGGVDIARAMRPVAIILYQIQIPTPIAVLYAIKPPVEQMDSVDIQRG